MAAYFENTNEIIMSKLNDASIYEYDRKEAFSVVKKAINLNSEIYVRFGAVSIYKIAFKILKIEAITDYYMMISEGFSKGEINRIKYDLNRDMLKNKIGVSANVIPFDVINKALQIVGWSL